MAQFVYTMHRVGKVVPPKRHILKNISLSFFPGAKIGVLGLNGAGKSTLLRIRLPGCKQGVNMSVIAQAGAKGRQLHKFGGSSLADVKGYLRVAGIMADYSQPDDMMVVSAAGSTTNQLISWLKLSQTDRLSAHQVQQALRRYQSELISGLLPPEVADGLIGAFIHDLERLAGLLDSGVNDAVYAEVVGHGEVWSARLMSAVLNQQGLESAWLDE